MKELQELFSPGALISFQYSFWKTDIVNHFMIINSDIHFVGDKVSLLLLRIDKGTVALEKITLWKTRENEWVSSRLRPDSHHEKFLGRIA